MICNNKERDKELMTGTSGPESAMTFIERSIAELSSQLAGEEALLAYSGGIASAVCAALLHRTQGVRLSSVLVNFRLPPENDAGKISMLYREVFGEGLEVMDTPIGLMQRLELARDANEKNRMLATGLTDLFVRLAGERGTTTIAMGTTCEGIVADRQAHPNHHSIVYQPFGPDINLIEPVSSLSRVEVCMVGIELGLPSKLTDSAHATMSYL